MVSCYRILHTYIHTIKPPVECFFGIKSEVSTAVPFYANGFAHRPKEIRKDKVYSQRADQCRFIGYADDVNWTNSPQISSHNTSNSVSYKDSYIVLMKDGKRLIRHDVIFELYQDQPTILKVDPADRDPSDPNQDSNYSSEQYLENFDRQLGQPIRDPHSIFSKSALQRKTESNKPSNSSSLENTSTVTPSNKKRNSQSKMQRDFFLTLVMIYLALFLSFNLF